AGDRRACGIAELHAYAEPTERTVLDHCQVRTVDEDTEPCWESASGADRMALEVERNAIRYYVEAYVSAVDGDVLSEPVCRVGSAKGPAGSDVDDGGVSGTDGYHHGEEHDGQATGRWRVVHVWASFGHEAHGGSHGRSVGEDPHRTSKRDAQSTS